LKIIEAICASSEFVKRMQISFDESTGLIHETGDHLGKPDFVYGDECLLFAGMGDIHVHAREDVSGKNNYKEDFVTARAAMHNGGVSHAGDMPNNPIPPIDNKSYLEKMKLAEKACGELWLYAGIGPGTSPLSETVPYKVYMGPSVGELFFKDLKTLDETLERYKGQHVSFHCEDPEILEEHKGGPHHHLRRPVIAEAVATRDALMLIEKHQLKGKLCHYSSKEGLGLIRSARARGVNVTIEVTPQHLYFDIEGIEEGQQKMFQMNPPIRYKSDKEEMMRAFLNGEIDYLATDHAPHTHEEKQKGTSGLTGLDTFAPFVAWLLGQGIDPRLIARVTSENPGRFHNQFLPTWKKQSASFATMGEGPGFLKKNHRANFTVIDTQRPLLLTAQHLKTKVGHSPFLGHTFPGSLRELFIGGKKA
jgi:dihydroorotase